MAGDIGIRERAIVLPGDGTAASLARSLQPDGQSRVQHVYGPRLVVAEVPSDDGASVAGLRAAPSEAEEVPPDVRRQLSPAERMGLDALALRQSPAYAEAKSNRPHDGAEWDSGEADAPACHEILDAGRSASADAGADAPTSAQLTGKVAVGIIIVEGPTAALKFSATERTKIVAEVQNGLGWLASQSPTGVTWVYDIQVVSIATQPGANTPDDQKEALWRDPAMAKLGYGSGLANVTQYVEALRTKYGTTWAYCCFFTKYPLRHFAYASIGGPRIVMDYANDGWGPDNIDRVFAHETGHIFGAPDEYASSGCSCGGAWGVYGKPNANCANCAPGGGVDCLMKANSWAMCAHTPYHLGFPLVQQTYTGVWRQGTDAYYLWVNASWTSFQSKWSQLAAQNLRLIDFKITRDGATERYHGVWRQGTGAHYLWVNADWASFQAKWQQLSAQNLRLVDVEITNFGGVLRYSGAWLPGTGGHYLWVNADWASFQAKWTQLAAQNLRLTDLRITNVGGQNRYTGVWRQGTGAHYLWVNADWASFVAKWQQLAAQNLRLVDIEISGTASDRRYSGVWLPGSDAYYLWAGASFQSFRAKWEELAAQGLRLIDLDVVAAAGPQSPTPGGSTIAESADRGGVADDPTQTYRPARPGIAVARANPTAYAGRAPTGASARGRASAVASAMGRGDGAGADDGADDGDGFGGGDLGSSVSGGAGEGVSGAGYGGGDLGARAEAGGPDDGGGFGGGDLGATRADDAAAGGEEDGFGGGDLRGAGAAASESDDGRGYGGGSIS
jgi:hypothetical protein